MDGTYRDLAALRGTYRLIDKTQAAILLIGRMLELFGTCSFEAETEVIHQVDSVLETMENVVTGDAIILDKCRSWINLNKGIIENNIETNSLVDFSSLK